MKKLFIGLTLLFSVISIGWGAQDAKVGESLSAPAPGANFCAYDRKVGKEATKTTKKTKIKVKKGATIIQ